MCGAASPADVMSAFGVKFDILRTFENGGWIKIITVHRAPPEGAIGSKHH